MADSKDRVARVERRRTRGEIKHEIELSSSENTAREQKKRQEGKERERWAKARIWAAMSA